MMFIAAFLATFLTLRLIAYALGPAVERVLARTAHWTARFRYRDYLPVLVVLAAGIAATAFAGDAFLDIAERVHAESPRLHEIDASTHEGARFTRTNGSTELFTTLTLIGTPVGLGILIAIVGTVLALKKRWRWLLDLAQSGSWKESENFMTNARPSLSKVALPRTHTVARGPRSLLFR